MFTAKRVMLDAVAALSACVAASEASATILFSESLQSNLSQWVAGYGYTGSGIITTPPVGGGKALTFGEITGDGDLDALGVVNPFVSGTGSFTVSFDVLATCGYAHGCGAFLYDGNAQWVADTTYTGQLFPDTGAWEHVSYTFAAPTAAIWLETWVGSPYAAADEVFWRNIELTDNPSGIAIGTLTYGPVTAVPELSTWTCCSGGSRRYSG